MTESPRPQRAATGLEALVARVNSPTEIVLNVGIVHGVKRGDTFRIMSTDGIPVNDPKTGEKLGLIPVEKGRVRVTSIYERICLAETYRTYTVGGGVSAMSTIFGPEREVLEKMEVEESPEAEVDTTVRVGDTATLVQLAK